MTCLPFRSSRSGAVGDGIRLPGLRELNLDKISLNMVGDGDQQPSSDSEDFGLDGSVTNRLPRASPSAAASSTQTHPEPVSVALARCHSHQPGARATAHHEMSSGATSPLTTNSEVMQTDMPVSSRGSSATESLRQRAVDCRIASAGPVRKHSSPHHVNSKAGKRARRDDSNWAACHSDPSGKHKCDSHHNCQQWKARHESQSIYQVLELHLRLYCGYIPFAKQSFNNAMASGLSTTKIEIDRVTLSILAYLLHTCHCQAIHEGRLTAHRAKMREVSSEAARSTELQLGDSLANIPIPDDLCCDHSKSRKQDQSQSQDREKQKVCTACKFDYCQPIFRAKEEDFISKVRSRNFTSATAPGAWIR